MRSRGAGSCVTEVLGLRRRPHLDHRPRERRRGRGDLARAGRRADGAHPAPRRQGQLLADGRHRPVRSVQRDPHRPRAGVRPRRRPAAATRTATASWSSGTSCSCSTTRRPTARARRCRSRRSTPAPGSSGSSRLLQGVDVGVGDRPDGAADRRRPARSPAGTYTRPATTTTATASPSASSPSTPARRRCSSPTACSRATRRRGYVLRRIIRRAVRYAYLLGTEQLVMPTLVDVADRRDGQRLPRRRQEPRLHRRRARPGGGALPPDAAQTASPILEGELVDGRGAAVRARPRSCSTTRTASRSS